jgi:hypothetical protein
MVDLTKLLDALTTVHGSGSIYAIGFDGANRFLYNNDYDQLHFVSQPGSPRLCEVSFRPAC